MAGTRETRSNGRLTIKKTLRRMKVKAAATKAEMSLVREEMVQMVGAMGEFKLEIDLCKASLHQYAKDMLLISESVEDLAQIILQL